jgi:hypothetical protein
LIDPATAEFYATRAEVELIVEKGMGSSFGGVPNPG